MDKRGLLGLILFFLTVSSYAFAFPKVGERPPDFKLLALDESKPVALDDLQGKVVLLNIWASWCTTCKAEMPEFVEMQERYRDQGFLIVGISVDNKKEKAIRFLKDLEMKTGKGVNFPVLYDEQKKVAESYHPIGMPSSYLIGKDGRLLRVFPGSFDKSNIGILKDAIEGALK
ncbi:MAG: TlpA disulfide reductase family protein [Candidatus Manganitrophus sp.]|nr:MAG: TlpA disulfide reductase family protein [Candidatus Manganitrophus sp.]